MEVNGGRGSEALNVRVNDRGCRTFLVAIRVAGFITYSETRVSFSSIISPRELGIWKMSPTYGRKVEALKEKSASASASMGTGKSPSALIPPPFVGCRVTPFLVCWPKIKCALLRARPAESVVMVADFKKLRRAIDIVVPPQKFKVGVQIASRCFRGEQAFPRSLRGAPQCMSVCHEALLEKCLECGGSTPLWSVLLLRSLLVRCLLDKRGAWPPQAKAASSRRTPKSFSSPSCARCKDSGIFCTKGRV